MNAIAVLVLISGMATAAAAPIDPIDPVTASPEMYTVLLENEHVRVVEYRIEPGEKEAWHTHPARTMYVLDGGTLKITLDDGTTLTSEEKTGEARWMGPVGRHYGENVGSTTVRVLMVEMKSGAGSVPAEDAASLRQSTEGAH